MTNLTIDQIIDLAEGRLPPSEAAELRARIAGDPAALAELHAYEELISLMRSDDSVDAPEHVIARAVRLVRPPFPARRSEVMRRILATLLGDSWQTPLAVGLRSDQTMPRSMTYTAEEYDLDLQMTPRIGRWHLRGQVLGPETSGSVILSGAGVSHNVPINEQGEFNLPLVDAGVYSLIIMLETCEIVIERLELSPLAPSI